MKEIVYVKKLMSNNEWRVFLAAVKRVKLAPSPQDVTVVDSGTA
jgi:hypothetical protein